MKQPPRKSVVELAAERGPAFTEVAVILFNKSLEIANQVLSNSPLLIIMNRGLIDDYTVSHLL